MFRLLALSFLLLVLYETGTVTSIPVEKNYNKIGVLKRHSSGSRNAGDIYIGTTKGVYLKYVGTYVTKKIESIDGPVTAIYIDFNGGVYVICKGKLYYIDENGENKQGVQSYIPYNVVSIGVVERKSGSRDAGDIYIGTVQGVYLKYVGTHNIKRIEGINEAVNAINVDINGAAYILTSNGKLYFIDTNGDNKGLQSYIPDKILSIGVLEKKSIYNYPENSQHFAPGKAGNIYIGTTEGVYLKYFGTQIFTKTDGINEPITAITYDFNGAAVVKTSTGKLYYIDPDGSNIEGVQSYIPDKVLTVRCLLQGSSGSRKVGDWYIGTTKGVYLKYVGTHSIKKIEGIKEAVVEIDFDFNGGAYIVTENGKLYYINENGENQGVQSYIPYKIA